MKLKELLNTINTVGERIFSSKAYLCGGAPRDRLAGIVKDKLSDIDITTGNKDIVYLAKETEIELAKSFSIKTKKSPDGHVTLFLDNFSIDFSSNFNLPNIEKILKEMNIKNPTDLEKEIYSRDFTCNAILMDLDLSNVYDITKKGISDIKDKFIRTILPPDYTFGGGDKIQSNRISRVIYLACKLDFAIDDEIINWIKNNKEIILLSDNHYIDKVINKALDMNQDKCIDLINQMNLWEYIPLTNRLIEFAPKKANLLFTLEKQGQLFRNFDYGEDSKTGPGTGLYQNLDKYKSVTDFRNKRRARRKKNIKMLLNTRPDRVGKNKIK